MKVCLAAAADVGRLESAVDEARRAVAARSRRPTSPRLPRVAAEGEAKRRRVPVWLETLILLAVALAAVNIFGGFLVTQRMLAMYKKKG